MRRTNKVPTRKKMQIDGKPMMPDAMSIATVSIFESLFLAMMDANLLSKTDIRNLLTDASEAHRAVAGSSGDREMHLQVAEMIERFRDGGNTTKAGDWLRGKGDKHA